MNITEKHPTSQDHREGVLAKTIEKQTAKLPSDSFSLAGTWLNCGFSNAKNLGTTKRRAFRRAMGSNVPGARSLQ
jgi:hypothetical protein